MRAITGKHGQTIISSTAFQLYDRIKHENGIYDKDLTSSDKHTANELYVIGVLTKVKQDGQLKYKIFTKD